MKCENYLELLSSYLDKQLTTQEAEQLEAHLKTCEKCREELEILEAIGTSLDSLENKELPQGFHAELMDKIHAEKQTKPFYQHKLFTYGSSIAAVLILVVIFSQGLNFDNLVEREQPEMTPMRSAMPEVASYTESSIGNVGIVQEPSALERSMIEETEQMMDEWYLVSEDGEATMELIEEWAKSNEYQTQTIIQGEQRTVTFLQKVDRQALKSLIEKQKNIQDFQWIDMKHESLSIIITKYNP
ncbi:MAG: anti-sigma factor family protein [Cellulosilyticaceae bacterium]